MDNMITSIDLSKSYGDVEAVSSLNLSVRQGEIYGFLGLNGAGKTTTIRMLLGMIKPDSGKAFIKNQLVHANNTELWKQIGYLVEIPYSYPNLTVRENLEMIRLLRKVEDKKAVDRIIDQLELNSFANRKAKNLSLGNKQRLGLAKALIHQPSILLLDEPSNGLDPAGIYGIREMLTNMAKNQGVTILISSHILGEISKFASRIGIIHQGKLIEEINSEQLELLTNKRLVIQCSNQDLALHLLQKNGITNCTLNNKHIEIYHASAIEQPDWIATLLVNSDCAPSLLKVEEEDLESYFLRTIKEKGAQSC
ncbi:MAG: ABC transporter ATP-binding protein [Prolixibacteraceae bacterium]